MKTPNPVKRPKADGEKTREDWHYL
jgi:hypothetical protein